MTVITAMKFNPKEGAMVADERSSGGMRQYDIATKIHLFSNGGNAKVVAGGSGVSDILYETVNKASEEIEKNKKEILNAKTIVEVLAYALSKMKRNLIESYLKSTFGLSEVNFQTGVIIMPDGTKSNIDPLLAQKYQQIIFPDERSGSYITNNDFLALASDENGVEIYHASMNMGTPITISRPYECIGSGRDMADGELYNFFEKIPRGLRNEIHPISGIAALLSAVEKASVRNVGVGGTPIIYIMKEGQVTNPSENNSRLAVEMIKGLRENLLPEGFVDKALESLLFHDMDYEEVEEEMWKVVKGKTKLDHLLRGYKI